MKRLVLVFNKEKEAKRDTAVGSLYLTMSGLSMSSAATNMTIRATSTIDNERPHTADES